MSNTAKPINWKQNLFFVWLSQLLSMAGFAAVMPFIPVYLRVKYGIEDPNVRGGYVAIFNFATMLSFAIFAPVWGWLADKFGRKIMLIRSGLAAGILFPMMAFAPNVWSLIFLRLFISIFSGTVTAANTLISSCTPDDRQGFALGTLSTALWSGNMIGFLFGGLVVHLFGYTAGFLLCGGLYLIGTLLVVFFVRENFTPPQKTTPDPAVEKPRGIRRYLPEFSAVLWLVLTLFLMMGFARRYEEFYLALQVEQIAGKEKTELYTGWICAVAALGGILSGTSIGWLIDKFSPKKVVLLALPVSCIFVLVQGFAPSLAVLGGARFIAFISSSSLEPAILSILSKITPREKRGTAYGWTATFRCLGMLLAAGSGGFLVYYAGVRSAFIVAGLGFLLLIPAIIFVDKQIQKTTPANAGE